MRWKGGLVLAVAAALAGGDAVAEGMIAPSQMLAETMTKLAELRAAPGADHLIFYAPTGSEESAAVSRGMTEVFGAHRGCVATRPDVEYAVAPAEGGYVVVFRFAKDRPSTCPKAATALVGMDGSARLVGLNEDEVSDR